MNKTAALEAIPGVVSNEARIVYRATGAALDPLPRLRPRTRAGRCYELSARLVIEASGKQGGTTAWTLVHGFAGGVQHAWLARDGLIYDATLHRFFSKAEYEAAFNPVVEAVYSSKAAAIELVKSGHSGPWHDQ